MWNKIIQYLLENAPAIKENQQAMFPKAFLVRFALELMWLSSVQYLTKKTMYRFQKGMVLEHKDQIAERIFVALTAPDRHDSWETMENKGFLLAGYMNGALCDEFGYEPVDWQQLDHEMSSVSKMLDEMFLNSDAFHLETMTDLLTVQLRGENA